MGKKDKNLIIISIIIAVVSLIIATYAVIVINKFGDEDFFNDKVGASIEVYVKKQQDKQAAAQAVPAEPIEVSLDDDAVKGDLNAPVTIVEFSDYQCPYCGRFFKDTLPQIQEKYIDTGKVKYVFRDYPLGFHPKARPAGMAAECVGELGGDEAYYKYHDILYKNQKALDNDSLKKYASDLGYDIADCLDSEKYADEIQNDFKDGASYGITGTPAFFINGRLLVGAQPFAAFEQLIEAELNK